MIQPDNKQIKLSYLKIILKKELYRAIIAAQLGNTFVVKSPSPFLSNLILLFFSNSTVSTVTNHQPRYIFYFKVLFRINQCL